MTACSTCRYYAADETLGGAVGLCRRDPPQLDFMPVYGDAPEPEYESEVDEDGFSVLTSTIVGPEQVDVTRGAVWPRVSADDWCGEHLEPGDVDPIIELARALKSAVARR